MSPLIPGLSLARRLTRKIWQRLRGRASDPPKLLPTGVCGTPLAEIIQSLEAVAPRKPASWWSLNWWRRGRSAKEPVRMVSRRRPQRGDGRRRFGSERLGGAESLEMRLALSTTWVDPQHENPLIAADTSTPSRITAAAAACSRRHPIR